MYGEKKVKQRLKLIGFVHLKMSLPAGLKLRDQYKYLSNDVVIAMLTQ